MQNISETIKTNSKTKTGKVIRVIGGLHGLCGLYIWIECNERYYNLSEEGKILKKTEKFGTVRFAYMNDNFLSRMTSMQVDVLFFRFSTFILKLF